jgi:hypothetical protein
MLKDDSNEKLREELSKLSEQQKKAKGISQQKYSHLDCLNMDIFFIRFIHHITDH